MNVQGFLKLTLLDYPGKTACTVFTGGCNLRCPFCHNASLVTSPMENANLSEETLRYLEKRKGILDGVCISGGEPLLQPDLADYISAIKAMGYSVKLDTNGALPRRLKEILPLTDYVAMDIKAGFDNYRAATGSEADVALFKESIEAIKHSGKDHEWRTTLVKGIHTLDDVRVIASYLEGERKYFLQGFIDSGNLISGGEAFTKAEMEEFLFEARKYIPEAELRGER